MCVYICIYIYVCIYLCIYVCMYVCIYIRMYVCMYVCHVYVYIGESPSGWGGGGATMALIAQVQFLQLMSRMGGSQAQTGLAYFANSLGE